MRAVRSRGVLQRAVLRFAVRSSLALLLAVALLGCQLPKSNEDPPRDAGADGGRADAGTDGGAPDTGRRGIDAGVLDELEPGFMDRCLVGPFEIGASDPMRSLELPPVNQYLCALNSIEGPFAAADDSASLAFDESTHFDGHVDRGVRWILSASPGARATAWCARVECFVDDDLAAVSLSGPLEALPPHTPMRPFEVAGGGECTPLTGWLWQGDASSYITELKGAWASREQRVSIAIPTFVCADGRTSCEDATFHLRNCGSSVVGARGHSYIAGIPHRPARFVGPTGTGIVRDVGEFVADSRDQSFLTLTAGPNGMCMLTGFAGSLARAGDSVDVVPMRDELGLVVWTMRVRAASEAGIEARARCYTYAQR